MNLPEEIRNKEFSVSLRGYNITEVEDYIEMLLEKYDELYEENAKLADRLMRLREQQEAEKAPLEEVPASEIDAKLAEKRREYRALCQKTEHFKQAVFALYQEHIRSLSSLKVPVDASANTEPPEPEQTKEEKRAEVPKTAVFSKPGSTGQPLASGKQAPVPTGNGSQPQKPEKAESGAPQAKKPEIKEPKKSEPETREPEKMQTRTVTEENGELTAQTRVMPALNFASREETAARTIDLGALNLSSSRHRTEQTELAFPEELSPEEPSPEELSPKTPKTAEGTGAAGSKPEDTRVLTSGLKITREPVGGAALSEPSYSDLLERLKRASADRETAPVNRKKYL